MAGEIIFSLVTQRAQAVDYERLGVPVRHPDRENIQQARKVAQVIEVSGSSDTANVFISSMRRISRSVSLSVSSCAMSSLLICPAHASLQRASRSPL